MAEAFYGTMPETLPKTLPVGTQCKAVVAVSQLTLDPAYHGYVGQFRYLNGDLSDPQAWVAVETVSWELVPVQPSEPEGWRPKVGDWCAGLGAGDRRPLEGRFVRHIARGGAFRCDAVELDVPGFRTKQCVRLDSLRPISPPPSGSASALTEEPRTHGPATTEPVGGGSSKRDPYRAHTIRTCLHDWDHFAGACRSCRCSHMDLAAAGGTIQGLERYDRMQRAKLAQAAEQLGRKVERRDPSDWDVDDVPSNVYLNGKP